ncbi:MAG: DsbE family thiol:disulfide interchange protein [Pseudomonadota bacterium]|nr:DsbE family thiol:disulfide interchange protein [Pseudomonadota bacterium]
MRKYITYSAITLLTLLFSVLLLASLYKDSHYVSTAMINKKFPKFAKYELRRLTKVISDDDLTGQVTLINVWSSWCRDCKEELNELMKLAKSKEVNLIGLNYRDDRASALEVLDIEGNPYSNVIFDPTGNLATRIGVYDIPETYVVDKNGIIRYKITVPLTKKVWQSKLLPVIHSLKKKG